jgi:hypothetical protein
LRVTSRGLGDVYKRQAIPQPISSMNSSLKPHLKSAVLLKVCSQVMATPQWSSSIVELRKVHVF